MADDIQPMRLETFSVRNPTFWACILVATVGAGCAVLVSSSSQFAAAAVGGQFLFGALVGALAVFAVRRRPTGDDVIKQATENAARACTEALRADAQRNRKRESRISRHARILESLARDARP